jgi:hypothetical protein
VTNRTTPDVLQASYASGARLSPGQLDALTSRPALPGSALTSARTPHLAALTVVAYDDSLVTSPRIHVHVHVAAEQLFGVAVPRQNC